MLWSFNIIIQYTFVVSSNVFSFCVNFGKIILFTNITTTATRCLRVSVLFIASKEVKSTFVCNENACMWMIDLSFCMTDACHANMFKTWRMYPWFDRIGKTPHCRLIWFLTLNKVQFRIQFWICWLMCCKFLYRVYSTDFW